MSHGEIYVFRAGSLGDAIVSLPAWHEIARRHPDRPLHLITPARRIPGIPTTADVFGMTGRLGEVIRYETSRLGLARTSLEVRRIGRGIVYCLMPERSTRDHVRDLVFMRGVLGLRPRGITPAILANLRRPLRPAYSPTVEWRRLLHCIGGDPAGLSFPLLRPSAAAEETADRVLAPFGDRPFLVACPGSKMPSKRWPADRFRSVLEDFLRSHEEGCVVLVGSPDERGLCESIAAACPERILNLTGRLSLDESAAISHRAVCYFGNDTGAMHVAAAMGRPCVAVFSARDYRGKWEPFGTGHTVFRDEPSCRHCMLIDCLQENLRCLTIINTETVAVRLDECWPKNANTQAVVELAHEGRGAFATLRLDSSGKDSQQ